MPILFHGYFYFGLQWSKLKSTSDKKELRKITKTQILSAYPSLKHCMASQLNRLFSKKIQLLIRFLKIQKIHLTDLIIEKRTTPLTVICILK